MDEVVLPETANLDAPEWLEDIPEIGLPELPPELDGRNFRLEQGRGALENPTGRFEKIQLVDNPDTDWPDYDELPPLKTELFNDHTKSFISYNDSPDIGFNCSMNPYRGCEHGCIYCYARPSHEYLGFSAGLDFESKIMVKMDAPMLLRKELSAKSWDPQPIALIGNTDCYQPTERKLKLTRQCLEVLLDFRNPAGVITKNHLITRDIDILSEMAKFNIVRVLISTTSLDEHIQRTMEPRASSPKLRLEAIRKLSEAGIPTGVMIGPIVPGLTDHEMDPILKAASEAGATFCTYTILRLPHGVKDLFSTWLGTHFPDRKNKVLNRVRDIRGGRLNDPRFGNRMTGDGKYADYIHSMFALSRKRYGLDRERAPLTTEHFRNPENHQLSLFGL